MNIERYSFGRVVVDGRIYVADLIILPERVIPDWRRKEGHRLLPEDLAAVVAAAPQALVVGTGRWGMVKVPPETLAFLESRGIEVHIAPSGRAAETFNRLQETKRTAACLHLTC
ncbi:MAG: hypothetical protein JW747_03640 [Candidatus Aminicenantes bacterium]|nr:hypothetical protein [Candidatus Aminicenantes bacterium]